MKLSFDEICDTWDNPESASIIEVRQALKGAIEMIKEMQKEIDRTEVEILHKFIDWHNEESTSCKYIPNSEIGKFKLENKPK